MLVAGLLVGGVPSRALALVSSNDTPFPSSQVIAGASWVGAQHGPPANQFGDILSTTWGADGSLYVLMDDGGTDITTRGALLRNSFAARRGSPVRSRCELAGAECIGG